MKTLAEGIIERGRGPEIAGSRITVYDVYDETMGGRTAEELAQDWRLSVEQIACALRYIEEHREEVVREFAEIKARHARERVFSEELVAQRRKTFKPANPELWEKFQRAKAAWEARRRWNPCGSQSVGANGSGAEDSGKPGVE